MTARRHPTRRRLVLLVAAALLAGAAACSADRPDRPDRTDPPAPSGPGAAAVTSGAAPRPAATPKAIDAGARIADPGPVDVDDPESVARAWATLAFNFDTAYDLSPHDAGLRAAVYVTAARAAALRSGRPEGSGPGADWNTWAAHGAWTDTEIVFGGEPRPSDTATTTHRQLIVAGTAHGRDGWTGPGPNATVFVALSRDVFAGWQVAQVRSFLS